MERRSLLKTLSAAAAAGAVTHLGGALLSQCRRYHTLRTQLRLPRCS